MLFEGGEAAKDAALVLKVRHAPFDSFIRFRAMGVHKLTYMLQDRLRKGCSFIDVVVDAWINGTHSKQSLSLEVMRRL